MHALLSGSQPLVPVSPERPEAAQAEPVLLSAAEGHSFASMAPLDFRSFGHYGHVDHNDRRVLMAKNRSVSEVKAKLSEYIRDAQRGDPVVITRHGQAIAALVGSEELETLERLRSAGPQGGLASVAGGWEDSDDLVRILETSSRVASRTAPSLD